MAGAVDPDPWALDSLAGTAPDFTLQHIPNKIPPYIVILVCVYATAMCMSNVQLTASKLD
jgi:hypothetical protein